MTQTPLRAGSLPTKAHRAADNPWIDRLARLGLASRGFVYGVVGVIAVKIAVGGSHHSADRNGALNTMAHNGFGRLLVILAAIGFAGYALWRLTEAIWGHEDEDGGKKVAKRLGSAGRTALYGFFAYSAVKTAINAGGGSSSDKTSKEWTARLMGQPFGRGLVIAVGVVFICAGAWWAWRGLKTKFDKKLKLDEMSPAMRKVVEAVGLAGHVARGIVFALVGVFLIRAAAMFDPKKAEGLDGSLREIAAQPWGVVALIAVAMGLIAFGMYSFAESRYRRT